MAGQSAEGAAGLIGKAQLSGQMDFGSSATSTAQGGRIGSTFINNSSGGSIGLVKMLALCGIGLIAWRLFGR